MKIHECDREAFFAPVYEIIDIPPFDEDGYYQLDESDFWNIYNPDEMDISESDRQELKRMRAEAKAQGEQYQKDVENFLNTVSDEATLKAAMLMTGSLSSFSEYYSMTMQYSETIEHRATLKKTIATLKQNVAVFKENNARLEQYQKEYPQSQETLRQQSEQIKELEKQIDLYEQKLKQDSLILNIIAKIDDNVERLNAKIDDQHAHAGELWATIPDCVRAALDAIEIEERDGKSISRPKTYDALRIAVVRRLKNKNTRKRTVKAGTFYPIADIAEAMAHEYRDFTAAQYIREFTPFGCLESNLHRAPQGTTEH
ncbi:MAG: hypothetical protein ACI4OV_04390 [Victivallaceae bacterium]